MAMEMRMGTAFESRTGRIRQVAGPEIELAREVARCETVEHRDREPEQRHGDDAENGAGQQVLDEAEGCRWRHVEGFGEIVQAPGAAFADRREGCREHELTDQGLQLAS